MLLFSNRRLVQAGGQSSFTAAFEPWSERLSFASVDAQGQLDTPDDEVEDAEALEQLIGAFERPDPPLLVYVHGFNNTAESMVERCLALEAAYGLRVVGFTWPAEGFLPDGKPMVATPAGEVGDEFVLAGVKPAPGPAGQSLKNRYKQAKVNADQSANAFARFLRLVGTARLHANTLPYSVGIHSLGNHLMEHALSVPGAVEGLGTAENVCLLAPCVRTAGHAHWLSRIRPNGRVFVTFHKADHVLAGASIADRNRKLGTDPGSDLLLSPMVRYVSFTNAQVDLGAHRYFIENLSEQTRSLFKDIFCSRPDLLPGQRPGDVYLFGCDPAGSVCFMGQPEGEQPLA